VDLQNCSRSRQSFGSARPLHAIVAVLVAELVTVDLAVLLAVDDAVVASVVVGVVAVPHDSHRLGQLA